MDTYGTLLRRARLLRGLTLRQTARALGCSQARLSTVERDVEAPFPTARTLAAAALLRCDPLPLVRAAVERRGFAKVPADAAPDLAALLELAWAEGLSGRQLADLARVLRRGRRKRK